MVYPVELGVGVVLLAVGYHLHYNRPLGRILGQESGADGSGLTTDGGNRRKRSAAAEQIVGATLLVLGLVVLVDGLGV